MRAASVGAPGNRLRVGTAASGAEILLTRPRAIERRTTAEQLAESRISSSARQLHLNVPSDVIREETGSCRVQMRKVAFSSDNSRLLNDGETRRKGAEDY